MTTKGVLAVALSNKWKFNSLACAYSLRLSLKKQVDILTLHMNVNYFGRTTI